MNDNVFYHGQMQQQFFLNSEGPIDLGLLNKPMIIYTKTIESVYTTLPGQWETDVTYLSYPLLKTFLILGAPPTQTCPCICYDPNVKWTTKLTIS